MQTKNKFLLKLIKLGRNRYKKKIIEQVTILEVVAEGKCLAKKDDLVIFVTGVIPGDIVDVLINKKKPNYLEGRPLKFYKYSENRIDAFCKHFGICGGCKWQNLPYKLQIEYKQKQVSDNFAHLGKFDFPEIMPILKSPKEKYYRNKLEYTFSNRRWLLSEEINDKEQNLNYNGLGFHIPKMFDKIIDIDECFLQPSPSNEIRLAIKKFAVENNLTFFNIRNNGGLLRNLIIRTSATTKDLMVIVAFYENDKKNIDLLLNFIASSFPEITSLMYVVNEKGNDSISDQEILL
ncbi:MAG: 23S rRNA (uracil-5-)-methyltransferase RumA, partial [Bacteroidetes bacterium]